MMTGCGFVCVCVCMIQGYVDASQQYGIGEGETIGIRSRISVGEG